MKIISFMSFMSMCMVFSACSFVEADREAEVPQPQAVDPTSDWVTRYLGAYGMELEIKLPPEIAPHTEIHWNDNFGRMEISAPAYTIDFIITGEIETVASRRFDLHAGIFKVVYLDEGDDYLLYKASLPDGSLPYFHFFKSVEIDDKTYQFQNNPLVEFGREQVELMLEISNSAASPQLADN